MYHRAPISPTAEYMFAHFHHAVRFSLVCIILHFHGQKLQPVLSPIAWDNIRGKLYHKEVGLDLLQSDDCLTDLAHSYKFLLAACSLSQTEPVFCVINTRNNIQNVRLPPIFLFFVPFFIMVSSSGYRVSLLKMSHYLPIWRGQAI